MLDHTRLMLCYSMLAIITIHCGKPYQPTSLHVSCRVVSSNFGALCFWKPEPSLPTNYSTKSHMLNEKPSIPQYTVPPKQTIVTMVEGAVPVVTGYCSQQIIFPSNTTPPLHMIKPIFLKKIGVLSY